MIRLFVGLALPDATREELGRIMSGIPGSSWEPDENLHVTIRFIGEVDGAMFDDVAAGLAEIDAPAFDLQIKGIGHFGDKRSLRTLWAGIASSPGLLHLRGKVESLLVRSGLEPDGRKYVPHVTLAKIRYAAPDRVAAFMAHHNLIAPPAFPVDEFHLFSSHTGDEHAVYRIEASYTLVRKP